jgi:hypothetical protein
VSFTPLRNSLAGSLTPVKLSKMVKAPRTSVVDTGEEFLIGIKDNGKQTLLVSLTPAKHRIYRISLQIIQKKLKLFLSMSIGTRRSSLTKKT